MSICSKSTRLLLIVLTLAMVLGAMPAFAEKNFQAVVTADSMAVYAQNAPYDYLGALPKGTQVTVEAYSGSAALISYKGRTGIARVKDMQAVAESASASDATGSAANTEAKQVIAVRNTRIYKKASTSSRYITVKAGTSMKLLAVNGNCAKVERDGAVGFAVYSHLGEPGSALQTETAAETQKSEAAEAAAQTTETKVQTGNAPVVTTQETRIYKKASTSSAYVSVAKGTQLTLLAISGNCAKVQRGSAIGYTTVDSLASDPNGGVQTADNKATAAKASSNPFASGSTEAAIYKFLTSEMGYNRAAALGVIANIKYESGYNPTIGGDGGTSYGLCQWHLGRKTNLINWCKQNDLDYTTVEGQLKFMQYELTTRYPSVHSYLKGVDNNAEGAYDAAYYFCFNFEAPASRTSQSTSRGKYARDTLYKL